MTQRALFVVMAIAGVGILMMALERLEPGRKFPRVDGWVVRAAAINLFQIFAVLIGGIGWNTLMLRHRLLLGDHLGTIRGAFIGYVALTFVYYWWHLWRHRSEFLWRWLHQIHHSPQRLELVTAFYKHPLEILGDSLLSSAVLYQVMGLSPASAAYAMALSGIAELFYHWNIRTPQWLGVIVQRPESHLIHHEEGLHDYNYSDLPIWDILFGTFRNPKQWDKTCGFGVYQEHMITEMLRGIDVSKLSPADEATMMAK